MAARLLVHSSAASSATLYARGKLLPPIHSDKNLNSNISNNNNKIVLQPRLATLRSYGTSSSGLFIKTAKDAAGDHVTPFIVKLFDYINTTKKTHDFEIISGRLAMIVFAGTVTTELLTGSSIFHKLDTQGIDEAALAAVAAVGFAALFAWGSIATQRVAGLFDFTSNASVVDSVVDQIVNGLFDEA